MPSTDEQAFLQAILDQPDDDAPRLIYADYLEEHGDVERAEFIRVQVALAGLEKHDPRRRDLTRRERSLLRRHKRAWLGELPTGVQFAGFRRGFAEVQVYTRAGNYLRKVEYWYTQTPLPHLFCLQLAGARRHLTAILPTPLMSRLVELSLFGNSIGDEGAKQLAAAPVLDRLSALCLSNNRIGRAGAEAIASSRWLTRLTSLNLGFNRLGDEGAAALAQSPALPRVVELRLLNCGIGTAGALALASAAHLARLSSLDVSMNAIGKDGCWALQQRFGSRVRMGFQARDAR